MLSIFLHSSISCREAGSVRLTATFSVSRSVAHRRCKQIFAEWVNDSHLEFSSCVDTNEVILKMAKILKKQSLLHLKSLREQFLKYMPHKISSESMEQREAWEKIAFLQVSPFLYSLQISISHSILDTVTTFSEGPNVINFRQICLCSLKKIQF